MVIFIRYDQGWCFGTLKPCQMPSIEFPVSQQNFVKQSVMNGSLSKRISENNLLISWSESWFQKYCTQIYAPTVWSIYAPMFRLIIFLTTLSLVISFQRLCTVAVQKSSHARKSLKISMGQYYNPCIITKREKRTRVLSWLRYGNSSYLGNKFVAAFEWLISPEGPRHKGRVVWAGDYGATEEGYDTNLYGLCVDKNLLAPKKSGAMYPLIVNHTKKCYLDKREVSGEIHPLPLLTMETADRGAGGDYRGINEQFLGIWARDVISVEKDGGAPADFEKVAFEFCE